MDNALEYLIGNLNKEEKERFDQWKADDAGADLIAFMDGLDSHEPLIWALQEVYLASIQREEYIRRMKAVSQFSKAFQAIQDLPHW